MSARAAFCAVFLFERGIIMFQLKIWLSVISAVFSLVLPLAFLVWLGVRKKLAAKAAGLGAAAYLVFSVLLQLGLQSLALFLYPGLGAGFGGAVVTSILFPALLFEGGKYVAARRFLAGRAGYETALSFGAGHGICQAVLFTAYQTVPDLLMLVSLNGAPDALSWSEAAQNAPLVIYHAAEASSFILPGLNQLFLFAIGIFLSVLVVFSVRVRRPAYFVMAVMLRAAACVPGALQVQGVISEIVQTVIMGAAAVLFSVLAVFMAKWFKKFRNQNELPQVQG